MGNRIPDEIVEQVQKSADIVEVIGEYVQLKNRGVIILGFVLFMVRTHHLFPFRRKTDFSLFWLRSGRERFFIFKTNGRLFIYRGCLSPGGQISNRSAGAGRSCIEHTAQAVRMNRKWRKLMIC